MRRLGIIGELALMVWHRRAWMLIPPLLALTLVLVLVVLGQATPLGPLIYPLF